MHVRPRVRSVIVSVLDQFRDAEQRVARRLKELEPAVAEYRELEEVAQRLGLDASKTATSSAAKRPSARRRATRTRATGTTRQATASSPAKTPPPRPRGNAP